MFKRGKPSQTNVIFEIMAGASPVLHLSGGPLKGRLMALLVNIRLGWKGLLVKNTPAYFKNS